MEKTLKFSEGIKMMDFAAFIYQKEEEEEGNEPYEEKMEWYIKKRFAEYCESKSIEYIEED